MTPGRTTGPTTGSATPGRVLDHRARPRTDDLARPRRWLLHGGRPASRWLIRRWYDVRVHGSEHVPADGPVVVAANHLGFVDGPLMAIFAPRPVHAWTKTEMFEGPLGPFLRTCGQVPLDRFTVDPRAVRTSIRVLRDGGVVGVFPEGQRGAGELELFHRGAAYLAMVTGAPVVPLCFLGTREPGGTMSSLPGRRARLDLVLGRPMSVVPTGWPRTREHVGETSRRLRAHLVAHIEDSVRRTGLSLPGPLPAGEHEPDPGDGVTERSA